MKKNNLGNYLIIGFFALLLGVIAITNSNLFNKSKTQILDSDLSTTEYNWYFNPREDHKQPDPIKEADFFKSYNTYYVGDPNEKVIYLTFDAGYENGYTNLLLDTLKKHNAPANFFVVKSYIENNKDLVNRMVKEGHLVCNHSKSHVSMASIDNIDKFNEEILSTAKAYKEVTGKEMPKYFRPPMGKFSERSLKYTQDLGYSTIFWSFAYVDWYDSNQPSHEEATLEHILGQLYFFTLIPKLMQKY